MFRLKALLAPFVASSASLARRLIFGTDLTVSAGATSYSSPGIRNGSSMSVPSGTLAPVRHGTFTNTDSNAKSVPARSACTVICLSPTVRTTWIAWSNKRQKSVVIRLQVVIHERVIVALGALHIVAKNDAADVARHQIWLGPTIERKAGRGPLSRIVAVGLKNFSDQHIPGFILAHALQQPGAPFIGGDVRIGSTLHQPQIERVGQVAGIVWRSKQAIHQPLPLIRSSIREECPSLIRSGWHSRQVERHATQKIGVGTLTGLETSHLSQTLVD